MISPLDQLLPYQKDWVDDKSRFKIGMWSRQTGKSMSTACEAVQDCMARKTTWVCLSAGERQALEWMRKAQDWTEAFEFAIDDIIEDRDNGHALLKSAEIVFKGGSRILAIPSNPATARGYSANLVLDEFAFHENPDKIWRAIFPSISNPLKGQYLLRIVSTPNGKANKFYDLWTKNEKYAKHLVDIYEAVKRGLPTDIEALKAGLDDPEGWQQEFLCQFIDEAAILLPYELIATCEHEDAERDWDWDWFNTENPLYFGYDVGRKHDLSVCWLLEKVGDVLWTRGIKELEKTKFRHQEEFLNEVMQRLSHSGHYSVQMGCIDETGIGANLAENLSDDYGARIEPCTFNIQLKQEIFNPLRTHFEDRQIRVPSDRKVREDLHGLHRVPSKAGQVRYLAPHNEDGHCDRATALALAIRAATTDEGPFEYDQVTRDDLAAMVDDSRPFVLQRGVIL